MGHLAPYFTSIAFTNFYLDISSSIVTTSAFVKKKNSKMRHLKKIVKPMEVNTFVSPIFLDVSSLSFSFLQHQQL